MNLSIPSSLLPQLHKKKRRALKVRKTLGKSKTVTIENLPQKKKGKPKIAKGGRSAKNTVTVEVPMEAEKPKKTLMDEILPEHLDSIANEADLQHFSVAALKRFCAEHGLPKGGRRNHLVRRVLEAVRDMSAQPDESDESEESEEAPVSDESEQPLESDDDVFDMDGNAVLDEDPDMGDPGAESMEED